MNFEVAYVFLFSQTTTISANQAVLFIRPYVTQQLRENNSNVATLLSVTENGSENIVTTFHDEAVTAVRMRFIISVSADKTEFGEQLVKSAVPVERTPIVRPFYCIQKTVEEIV